MTIELNNTNCAELTSEEFEAKVDELNADVNLDFDLDGLFDDNNEDETEVETEVETVAEVTKEQKQWLKEIEKYETLLADWSARTYKKTKATAYVGTELDGGSYSYGYVNERRKQKNIANFTSYLAEYKQFLKESGYKAN